MELDIQDLITSSEDELKRLMVVSVLRHIV